MKVTLDIQRFDPKTGEVPRRQTYDVTVEPTDRVLDALMHISRHEDGTLAFRKSCAHGVCGSDAMRISGKEGLACKTLIRDVADKDGDVITLDPLNHMTVQKDLMVDQSEFLSKFRAVEPFLMPKEAAPASGEFYQSAEDRALGAGGIVTEVGAPESLWRIWNGLRESLAAGTSDSADPSISPHPEAAILAGKQAVNSIQAMRAASSGLEPRLQQSFLNDKESVYRALANLLIAQDRPAEAQQVLDMLKEREFYDYIQADDTEDPRTTRTIYNAIEAEWNTGYAAAADPLPELAGRIETLNRIDPSARTDGEQAELARLAAERDTLTAELERHLADLPEHFAAITPQARAKQNARLAAAPGNKRALLADLSQRSGTRTGLLQFILLPGHVRILLTTPEGWHSTVTEITQEELNARIETLAKALRNRKSRPEEPAKALYDALVAPLADQIEAAKLESLLVHLDGRLRYIPFAALHDGERWLAERWSLVYYTAASERQADLDIKDWQVAGLGTTRAHPPHFTALPAVADEIDGIVREDPDDPEGVLPGSVHLDQAFTETVLRRQAADRANGILHIATHFDLQPGDDSRSHLLLGTGETLSLRDLRLSDPALDLRHIDLVTLSACNTAMGGADGTGVEIEGMGTIVQRQGARGVLASLWPVADASTGVLMQTFYRLRGERPELTKAQALRQAQLSLLHGLL